MKRRTERPSRPAVSRCGSGALGARPSGSGRAAAAGLLAALALPVAPAAGPLPASAQEEDTVLLRLQAEEGESATYRAESTIRLRPMPGQETAAMAGSTTSTVTIRRTVTGREDDVITYATRVEGLQMEVETENQQMRTQLEQAARQARRQVQGTEFTLSVSSRGEPVSMGAGADTAGAVLGSAGALQQMGQSLRQFGLAVLPEEPVSVGDSWSSVDTAGVAQFGIPFPGQVVTRTTTTLARLLRQPGGRVAELQVESTFHISSGAEDQPVRVRLDGSSAETVRFHVERGRLLSSTGAQDITIDYSVPGQQGASGSFQMQGETRVRLTGS